ncbi:fructose-specific PTS transporter subunit EIIC [Spiroplasma cantharicola]|uniref:PTS system, fructose-specific IIB component n=1 Tax=Spiroplasma cantharicola TaxID=362837 RepID=A0A0M4JIP4_9MOLU|nr:fructose-specific PTS transporter subunit EIIC [Spiroplasma cantharicola]ALD66516.1 PTS system, fructose-specific IIB component [Spiroplasma cantharicola]
MENIYKEKNIFLNIDLNSKDEVLKYICNKANELGIYQDTKSLLKAFYDREKQGTTGFEDGFAIPHAKVKGITSASIICIRTLNGIEWEALDGQPSNVIIALIIPENASKEHLDILSQTAKKLMDDKLRQKLKDAKDSKEFSKLIQVKQAVIKNNQDDNKKSGKNIVAVTACVVGVAHTYMAEDKLLSELSKAGYNIRVETQGSKGIGTPLTTKEIENADVVIIAADTKVNLQRFNGKPVYQTHVARAIKEPLKLVDEAFAKATIQMNSEFKNDGGMNKSKQGVLQHILAGISYMIPVIIMGGICLAFSIGIAKAIWGPSAGTGGPIGENGEPLYPWNPLAVMDKIGGAAFALMIPILAGFIANSIAGRAAIAPAMLGAFIGNDASKFMPLPGMTEVSTPTGFIGAIIAGLLVGYYVKWVNTWKVHKSLKAVMPIFFIPLTAGIGISILFIYILGGPIGWLMNQLSSAIESGYRSESFGIGLGIGLGILLGAMASFDMGGPINKIAFVTCSALVTLENPIAEPMGAMAAAIPVAPLAMGLSTILFKRFFTNEERGMGISAMIMGTIGISEGAIPFAIRDPKRAIIANVLGGMVAGAIAGGFQVTDLAAHGGPIVAILGAVPYGWFTIIFFIAILAGVTVTTLVYGTLLILNKGNIGSLKEHHVLKMEQIIENKKEKIEEIRNQMLVLKDSLKSAKTQNDLDNIHKEINNLKEEKQKINIEAKEQIQLAKNAFNQLKDSEKLFIKENSNKIKEFIKNSKLTRKNSLQEISNKKNQEVVNLQKFDKRNYLENYSNQVDLIKDDYQKSIVDYQIKLKEKFIIDYNKLINN